MFLNPWYSGQQQQQQPQSSASQPQPLNSQDVSEGNTTSVVLPNPENGVINDLKNINHVGSSGSSLGGLSPAPSPRLPPRSLDNKNQQIEELQRTLRSGWTVHMSGDGRFYYCNHVTQTSGWLPPADSWDSGGGLNLPYGWEAAQDHEGKVYYVNHLNKTTTYEDPRKWLPIDPEDIPEPRMVELTRDPELGFGFVAGSEKPVIVRFVTSGGPSVSKLRPGDQILQINGEDVKGAPRDHVIQLVRNCRETVSLVVCQPPLDNSSTRKSALLSAAKKAKLKSNPSRVRFAESVDINGSPAHNGSLANNSDSVVPLMPNVLKVFLENGQTKSFKYDSSTTVQDVIDSLQIKLGLGSTVHFALVVEHVKSLRRNKLTLLDPKETLCRIASRPGAHNLRCLFRVTFVPLDAYDLLRKDSVAFEYLYVQCCNDVVQERFAPELKYDIALRLAALHIHQHTVATNGPMAKANIKTIEKESGLESFVPNSLAESMKRKELKKLLGHFLKMNTNLTAPGQKNLTALQAKLHYLKIISELPSYGAKCFSTTLSDSNAETVILISPKFGISQINSLRNSVPQNLCDIEQVTRLEVSKEDELTHKIDVHLKDPDKDKLSLTLEYRDAEELILVLHGYHQLLTERQLEILQDHSILQQQQQQQQEEEQQVLASTAPPYCSKHRVTSQGWNYPVPRSGEDTMEREFMADFNLPLPYHAPPEGFRMSSDSSSDADSSMTSSSTTTTEERNNSIDRNRNITGLENNANFNAVKQLTTFNNNLNNQIMSENGVGGTFKLLKKPPPVPHSTPIHRPLKTTEDQDEYEKSMAELDQIVADVSQYFDLEQSKCKPRKTLAFKHIDSILLSLSRKDDNEENKDPVPRNFIINRDPYPASSPLPEHAKAPPPPPPLRTRPSITVNSRLKPSDSSFGLHSPDNIPLGLNPQDDKVQDIMKQLKTTKDALVLDPDLIDLTIIPPPMTPDEDGFNRVFPGAASAVSTPPTPFADRESLEAELKALEKDIDHIQKLKAYNGWATNGSAAKPISADDTLSDGSSINSYNYEDEAAASASQAAAGIAAVYQLRDIDSFIANVTVPPPPGTLDPSVQNGDLDDISAFIIPPPPLLKSTEDREVNEVKVPTPKIMENQKEKISPKIASIQQKFLSSHQDTLTRKKPMAPAPPPEHNLPPPPPPPRSSIPAFPKKYEFGAPAPPRPTKLTLDSSVNPPAPPPPPPPAKTLSKMSLTSSSDSLSSNASVNTVKSVSPTKPDDEAPPSLPPRQSPTKSPSRPPLASPEDMTSPPSVATKKPVVPSRASKPTLSPNKEMRALPPVPTKVNSESPEKSSTPPSLPPLMAKSHTNSPVRKIIDSMETNEEKPKLPSKTAIGGRKLPVPPPNSTQPAKLTNGVGHSKPNNGYKMEVYTNSHFDHEDRGTSVDDSDDDDSGSTPPKTKFILGPPVGESNDYDSDSSDLFHSEFHKAEEVLHKVLQHIDEAHGLCNSDKSGAALLHKSKDAYSKAKEQLTNESRQFVTASKLFVKSATESEGQLVDCLNHCVVMIDKIGLITVEVARHTPTPMQTQSLIVKVRDVADTFLQAVLAAGNATGRDMNDPAMNVLMKKATNLASVLTTLMRSLRVFN